MEDALGVFQIAKAHATKIEQYGTRWKTLADQRRDRLRQQDLAAVRDAHDSSGAVDRYTEEVIVAALCHPGVKPSAHAQCNAVRRGGIGEPLLQLQRRGDRIERIVERAVRAVAAHFYDYAVVILNGGAHDRVVARECKLHPIVLAIPQSRAALDVGEQECRDAG